ncbi:MAG: LON peptidase substrate-binding domain-containing protein [Candidatus Hydrogenedentes bacterium]|nr:LON peptidase substrate-binding domain-containing protein [Candidatus Hydrogenedentota bacterium]
MFLPLFPLELVVFPGEDLHLHIFEPRYKQLIGDCKRHATTFGIPAVYEERLTIHGTEMELVEIRTVYPNGELDIVTRGLHVFRIDSFIRDIPDKLYSGGNVTLLVNDASDHDEIKTELTRQYAQLHDLLQTGRQLEKPPPENLSFRIAQEVGMRIEEKLLLLGMARESDRQRLIIEHLRKAIPIIRAAEETKKRLSGNGHFRKPPEIVL